MIQAAITELLRRGPLPDSAADEKLIAEYETLLGRVMRPVSDEDAKALVSLFGPDDCYGLAWSLLHLIESAPGWPIAECLQSHSNEWIDRLRRRLDNAQHFSRR